MDTKDLSKRRQIFASRYRTTQKTSASLLCDHRTYVKIVFGTLRFLNTRTIFLLTDVTTHLPSAILSYRIPTSNEKRVYWMWRVSVVRSKYFQNHLKYMVSKNQLSTVTYWNKKRALWLTAKWKIGDPLFSAVMHMVWAKKCLELADTIMSIES